MLSLLSDMGNIFGSKTTFEVAVAEFIATRDIRETNNDTLLYISTVQSRLLHNLVERCSHSDKFFFCHTAI